MSMKLLNRDPKELVIELINVANPNNVLKDEHCVITDAADNGNTAYSENTRAKVCPVACTDPAYRDDSYVWYNRISISDFFLGYQPKLLIDDSVKTAADIIPLVQATYGIVIDPDGFIDSSVVRGDVYPYPFTLELKPNGLAWKGSTTFLLIDPKIDLQELVENPVLDGLRFPFYTSQRVQGLLYSYGVDFSGMRNELKVLSVGDDISALVPLINNIAPTRWSYSNKPAKSNFFGARVQATGTLDELLEEGYPLNPEFQYAAVIRLSTEYCTDFGGIVLLQYN